MTVTKRRLFAATPHAILLGSRRLAREMGEEGGKFGRGVVTEFAQATAEEALAAFDRVARDPGHVSILTSEETRIDFLFRGRFSSALARLFGRREPPPVTLDLWFEEEPDPPLADVLAIPEGAARELVGRVFAAERDEELWRFLRGHTGSRA